MMTKSFRTPESVKAKIDNMLKKGEVVLDHGICAYEFDHYEYEEASWKNGYTSSLSIYYKDFDVNKTVRLYLVLTEKNLRKATKTDYFVELVDCYWEKEFPTLLNMREYYVC